MNRGSIDLNSANYRPGDTVRGTARLNLADRFDGTVAVFWEDSEGRILQRVEKRAAFPAAREIRFAFPLNSFPLTNVNKVVLQATDHLEVRRWRTETRFTVTKPRGAWDDYKMILWGEKREWASAEYMELMKQSGITTAMAYAVLPIRPRRDHNWLSDHDMPFYVENVCQIGWDGKIAGQLHEQFVSKAYRNGNDQVPDKRYLVRKPCMNDPAYWAASKQRIQNEVRARREFQPLAYSIGDEQSISFFTTPYDFCFSDYCLRAFRQWLRKTYGRLDRMNEVWETDFRAWTDVVPLTREEARARGSRSFAPWADHRDFMDSQFAALVERFIGYVHEIEPRACAGIEGTQKPSCYGGYDYWKLMKGRMTLLEAYDIAGSHRIASSFNHNRCALVNLIGCDQDSRSRVWQKLLHGDRASIIWWLPAFANPDGSVREPVKIQKSAWDEYTGGIAKLLDAETSVHDGVAIHYSAASIRGKWITMKEIPFTGDHEISNTIDLERLAFMRLVEDMGYAYRFVSYEQVERDGLADYKALILPNSIALSDGEVARIKEFVKRGGLLIADYEAGWMDEHCRYRATGALDEVFGVAREDFSVQPFETSTYKSGGGYWFEKAPPLGAHQVLMNRNFESLKLMSGRLYYPAVESTLKPTTGVATGHEGDVPAMIVNRYGKGMAVLMNLRILYYYNHRMSAKSQVWTQMTLRPMKAIFELAGVRPAAPVSGRGVGVERVMFRDGKADYHALRCNPDEVQGGLGEFEGPVNFDKPTDVTVTLPRAGHVYESRTGKYLGVTGSARGTIPHPEPLVYAVLPYKVIDLGLDAQAAYRRGDKVTLRIRLLTPRPTQFVRHVFRCRLYGPDTRERTAVRQNIKTAAGRATFRFDLALNEMAGTYRMVVRDIATGIEREHRFTVE